MVNLFITNRNPVEEEVGIKEYKKYLEWKMQERAFKEVK